MRLKQDEKIHEMALKQKREKEAGLFDHLGCKYLFLPGEHRSYNRVFKISSEILCRPPPRPPPP